MSNSATLWIAARQASLSITNSQSLPKLVSIELVMPSSHLILCCPLLLLPSIFPSITVFSSEWVLHIRRPEDWSFRFSSDFAAKKIKSVSAFTVSPSLCHEVMGPDAMIFVFWMLSFKPTFSLSSFTFIKRLFGSSLLSAVREVSPACWKSFIFLLTVLIPAWDSSSLAFRVIHSAYWVNKLGDSLASF